MSQFRFNGNVVNSGFMSVMNHGSLSTTRERGNYKIANHFRGQSIVNGVVYNHPPGNYNMAIRGGKVYYDGVLQNPGSSSSSSSSPKRVKLSDAVEHVMQIKVDAGAVEDPKKWIHLPESPSSFNICGMLDHTAVSVESGDEFSIRITSNTLLENKTLIVDDNILNLGGVDDRCEVVVTVPESLKTLKFIEINALTMTKVDLPQLALLVRTESECMVNMKRVKLAGLRMDACAGEFSLNKLVGCSQGLRLVNSSDTIHVEKSTFGGFVDASTQSGDIEFVDNTAESRVLLSSMSGDVSLDGGSFPLGDVTLKSMSGDSIVKNYNASSGFVKVSTMSGDASLLKVSGSGFSATSMSGDTKLVQNGHIAGEVFLSTMSGTVTGNGWVKKLTISGYSKFKRVKQPTQ